jgi:hypothetical protein
MKDYEKKKKADDLPANRPVSKPEDKVKTAKEPVDKPTADTKDQSELERMKNRLAVARDPRERKMILDAVQERFGNEIAEKIIAELRLRKDEKKED